MVLILSIDVAKKAHRKSSVSFSHCACFQLPGLVDWSKKEIELLNEGSYTG